LSTDPPTGSVQSQERAQTMADRRLRHSWRIAAPLLAILAVALAVAPERPARAQTIGDLYQANAIVTGTDMRMRPWGFAQCLREVLVKVSGEPKLRNDPRVTKLAAHADRLVTYFDYVDLMAGQPRKDDQGTYDRPHRLTVRFDPAKIDKVLEDLGAPPWRGVRPVLVPVILVHGWKPPPYLLDLENPVGEYQRESFVNAIGEYGMKYRIPTETELAAWGVGVDGFPAPKAKLRPEQVIVAGTLDWNAATPGWTGSWWMRWKGVDHAWRISGVTFDAAFKDMVRGFVLLASGHGTPG
jgi:hypothetical protein